MIYLELTPALGTVTFDMLDILVFLLYAILSIIIHELIHGIFFKLGTKEKVSYKFHGWAASASVKGIYFYKHHYVLTGLAPFMIITPLLVACIFIFPAEALGLYTLIAFHTASCIGDFYVVYKLSKFGDQTLIHDYGIGMTFYTKD